MVLNVKEATFNYEGPALIRKGIQKQLSTKLLISMSALTWWSMALLMALMTMVITWFGDIFVALCSPTLHGQDLWTPDNHTY